MASINRKSVEDLDLTLISIKGIFKVEDALESLDDLYSSGKVSTNIIWDLTEADISSIGKTNLKILSDAVRGKISVRHGGKTAFIMSGDTNFGLGRMYEIYCDVNNIDVKISVFKNIVDAVEWIKN